MNIRILIGIFFISLFMIGCMPEDREEYCYEFKYHGKYEGKELTCDSFQFTECGALLSDCEGDENSKYYCIAPVWEEDMCK